MNSERWRRVNELFEQAVERPAAQRQRFLDDACAGDAALRDAVERRLRADAEAGSFLEEPLGSPATIDAAAQRDAAPAARLGPYRILHEIGRGGMGTVYAAERDDDAFRRLVAVKVITSSSQNAEIPRRLRAERRILALLEHPNIARIYDGGATEDGAPYLVMEHVEGETIDRYCTTHNLPIEQRLELIGKVCSAVHYAHRNLVVHRDLKPSNILVTPDGEPKLLDFGIAKVLDPAALGHGETVEATAPWRRLLTLDYASPEQLRGEQISTASDVYSLGVLLFLLLTGSLPRALADLSPWQVERSLSTTEPPRPSVTVVEPAGADSRPPGEPPQLARRLRGDLDAIVLKALRSDPDARYGSAEQLAADLDLYLRGFPVGARRGTWRYRAGKLLRRHRLAVISSAVALSLGLALLVSLALSRSHLARSQGLLQEERVKLEQMLGFFLDMFEDAGPYAAEGVELSLRQAVDRQATRLAGELQSQPRVRAAILSTLGWVYLDLGSADRALELHQQALELRRRSFGDEAVEVAESLDGVAAALRDAWQLDDAAARSADALELYRRHSTADRRLLLRCLNNRVKLFCLTQDWRAADPLSAEALALGRSGFDERELEVSRALVQRALVVSHLGDPETARALYRETLELYESRYGQTHPVLAPLYNNLGQLAAQAGRTRQAVDYWRQADAQYAAAFGDDFYERVKPLTNQGRHLHRIGDLEGAENALRSALEVALSSPVLGPQNEIGYYGRPAVALGRLLEESGRCAEAVELLAAKVEAWASRTDRPEVQEARALIERCEATAIPQRP